MRTFATYKPDHWAKDPKITRRPSAYVRPMWLKPDIRRAWTDEGYETTTNILENLWHHVDANMLNGVYNTHVHTGCLHLLGYDTKGRHFLSSEFSKWETCNSTTLTRAA